MELLFEFLLLRFEAFRYDYNTIAENPDSTERVQDNYKW